MAIRQMAFTSDEALLCSAQRMQLNVSALPCQRPPGLGQKEWESMRLQVKAQVLGLALSDLRPATTNSQASISSSV